MKPILIMGLPGSGKTVLAKLLARELKAVHWNADDVRGNINTDLHFSTADRIEQARRMSWLSKTVNKAGHCCVVDFVCPLQECRDIFGPAFVVWVDRIKEGRFENTNKIFEPPTSYDVKIENGMTLLEEVNLIIHTINMQNKNGI